MEPAEGRDWFIQQRTGCGEGATTIQEFGDIDIQLRREEGTRGFGSGSIEIDLSGDNSAVGTAIRLCTEDQVEGEEPVAAEIACCMIMDFKEWREDRREARRARRDENSEQ